MPITMSKCAAIACLLTVIIVGSILVATLSSDKHHHHDDDDDDDGSTPAPHHHPTSSPTVAPIPVQSVTTAGVEDDVANGNRQRYNNFWADMLRDVCLLNTAACGGSGHLPSYDGPAGLTAGHIDATNGTLPSVWRHYAARAQRELKLDLARAPPGQDSHKFALMKKMFGKSTDLFDNWHGVKPAECIAFDRLLQQYHPAMRAWLGAMDVPFPLRSEVPGTNPNWPVYAVYDARTFSGYVKQIGALATFARERSEGLYWERVNAFAVANNFRLLRAPLTLEISFASDLCDFYLDDSDFEAGSSELYNGVALREYTMSSAQQTILQSAISAAKPYVCAYRTYLVDKQAQFLAGARFATSVVGTSTYWTNNGVTHCARGSTNQQVAASATTASEWSADFLAEMQATRTVAEPILTSLGALPWQETWQHFRSEANTAIPFFGTGLGYCTSGDLSRDVYRHLSSAEARVNMLGNVTTPLHRMGVIVAPNFGGGCTGVLTGNAFVASSFGDYAQKTDALVMFDAFMAPEQTKVTVLHEHTHVMQASKDADYQALEVMTFIVSNAEAIFPVLPVWEHGASIEGGALYTERLAAPLDTDYFADDTEKAVAIRELWHQFFRMARAALTVGLHSGSLTVAAAQTFYETERWRPFSTVTTTQLRNNQLIADFYNTAPTLATTAYGLGYWRYAKLRQLVAAANCPQSSLAISKPEKIVYEASIRYSVGITAAESAIRAYISRGCTGDLSLDAVL